MPSRLAKIFLSQSQKHKIKTTARKLKSAYVKRFRSYNYDQLLSALAAVGVEADDALMVHSSYLADNGFRESPTRIVSAFQEAIGPGGTLLMPSSHYTTSTDEYVKNTKSFDVNRTTSHMGLLSEIFRRQKGTVRSLHPAHPVLASGPLASWFIEGHADLVHSCGPGSPFEKLIESDAKALFFDALPTHLMFFHYLEHIVNDDLPFPLYDSQIYQVLVIDEKGQERSVGVCPFSKEARTRRRFNILEEELRRLDMVRAQRVGNTMLMRISIRDTLKATRNLRSRGAYFYDLSGYD